MLKGVTGISDRGFNAKGESQMPITSNSAKIVPAIKRVGNSKKNVTANRRLPSIQAIRRYVLNSLAGTPSPYDARRFEQRFSW
jgi:hypothetical protein